MVRYLEYIKAICKQSSMWEIDNPRVIGMINNIVTCVQKEDLVDKESKEYFIDLVLSNLMIYSKYNFEEVS